MENNPYSSPAANLFGSTSGTSTELVTPGVINKLQRTKPWIRFIGVLLWIMIVFMMIGAVGMTFATTMMAGEFDKTMPGMGGVFAGAMIGGYLLFGFLYIYPAVKIWSYGTWIGKLVKSGSHDDLEKALDQQRAFWKFIGIITLILIVAYIAVIVIAIAGGIAAAAAGGLPKS